MKIASLTRWSTIAYTLSLVVTASTSARAQAPQAQEPTPPSEANPATEPSAPASSPASPGADTPATSGPATGAEPAPAPAASSGEPQHHTPPGPPPSENPKYFHATEVQYLHGWRYKELGGQPGTTKKLQKDILTFQHYSEWALGRNFFFFDLIKSASGDGNAQEIYGEAYTSLSASKVLGSSLSASIFDDINLTFGVNAGAKSNGASPFILLPGITTDWKIPGFTFFHVDVLAYIDQGRFAGSSNQCRPSSFQITPAWDAPFQIGPLRVDFQGFVDIIGGHGACEYQVLAQPQLRFDVGNFFGKQDRIFIGTEIQYWVNKYGIKDMTEFNPQTLLVWRL